jgi:uncharacterized protein YkwD
MTPFTLLRRQAVALWQRYWPPARRRLQLQTRRSQRLAYWAKRVYDLPPDHRNQLLAGIYLTQWHQPLIDEMARQNAAAVEQLRLQMERAMANPAHHGTEIGSIRIPAYNYGKHWPIGAKLWGASAPHAQVVLADLRRSNSPRGYAQRMLDADFDSLLTEILNTRDDMTIAAQGPKPNPPEPEPDPTPTPDPTPAPTEPILQLLALHNKARADAGVDPLTASIVLTAAASAHATWMAETERMSHTGDGGSSVSSRVKQAGYEFRMVGENIAYGSTTPKGVFDLWWNSSGHRRNILRADYTEVGLALAKTSRGITYWCAVFGRPVSDVSAFSSDVPSQSELEPYGLQGPVGIEQEWTKP